MDNDHAHHKILYIGIAGALLLLGAGVFYYLVIFLPHQAVLKAQQEQASLHVQQQAFELQRQQKADQAAAALQQQQQAAAAADQRKSDRAANLQICLENASTNEKGFWTTACAAGIGIDNRGPDCTLPSSQVAEITINYKQDKADCFKQYPQN